MHANLIILLYLPLAWLLYFIIHSAFASLTVKHWIAASWPRCAPYYRLYYNLGACALLIPPLWLRYAAPDVPLWAWHGAWRWNANILPIFALLGFWWSLRHYNIREFLGLRQQQATHEQSRLILSPPHRYVRHPWYFLGLVVTWTRDMDLAWLIRAIGITLYVFIGSHLEDRKLANEFGEPYQRYRQLVPVLIPLPGHCLNRADATALVAAADHLPAQSANKP